MELVAALERLDDTEAALVLWKKTMETHQRGAPRATTESASSAGR